MLFYRVIRPLTDTFCNSVILRRYRPNAHRQCATRKLVLLTRGEQARDFAGARCSPPLRTRSDYLRAIYWHRGHIPRSVTELQRISVNLVVILYSVELIASLQVHMNIGEVKERERVVKALGQMFAAPGSTLADSSPDLWQAWLHKFTDQDVDVRKLCIQASQEILINRPELRAQVVPVAFASPCKQLHFSSARV